MTARNILLRGLLFFCSFPIQLVHSQEAANKKSPVKPSLVFPMLLEKDKRMAGNPLATYVAMIELEQDYRTSPFAPVYDEIKYNFEEFLGFPDAGIKAMSLPQYKKTTGGTADVDLTSWKLVPAIQVLKEEAQKTRVVIWAEEHHLPQTRALLEEMIIELWALGYRHLAAEAFTGGLRDSTLPYVNYNSGFYTQDPVFASAINLATQMGFHLVDYDTEETSPTEPSLRDIRQAENLYNRILKNDPTAKVLIIAGRGHGSEIESGGWKPMAYNLKKLSGIDPFTLMTQTMTERSSPDEEHPLYRKLTGKGELKQISLLKNKTTGRYFSSDAFDAYVFFPKTMIRHGRPNWTFQRLKRRAITNPFKNVPPGVELFLVQAFVEGQPTATIPADQFVITRKDMAKSLALSPGNYYIRMVDRNTNIIAEKTIKVK